MAIWLFGIFYVTYVRKYNLKLFLKNYTNKVKIFYYYSLQAVKVTIYSNPDFLSDLIVNVNFWVKEKLSRNIALYSKYFKDTDSELKNVVFKKKVHSEKEKERKNEFNFIIASVNRNLD